ncbi:cell division control protein 1 [Trichophyton equinum CBS 127.97]|uniref:Cell division control protein 1 n=1 Tax=Trichophyton equinum (strain ATCC MYA-4606 / CBS 127.97) TaxID=559882 RepID=F2PWT1_TRIEC|nr:cell division control protein 1 [Trichophyton equinum CBS 127.97]
MTYLHSDYSNRSPFAEPTTFEKVSQRLPAIFRWGADRIRTRVAFFGNIPSLTTRRNGRPGVVKAVLQALFTVRTALILLWGLTLWWGERTVFKESLKACNWSHWEKWPANAKPHHVAFIADPQLVDAHTYPGRPWPLSSLTEFYVDLYLYRTHSLLQKYLRPDSTFFLGDLFDGGREWGTDRYSSPDPIFKNYGHDYWMKEYKRFSRIFFETWELGGKGSSLSHSGRRMVAGLPGNHDIGFGNGVQMPVVHRFRSFFGESNRVDIVGNHTIVSIDSVSYSARDQENPETGGSNPNNRETAPVWRETQQFLDNMKTLKQEALRKELSTLTGKDSPATDPDIQLPTILLTHVPLYREPHTPCGPLREHWPPSSTNPLPDKDERNAIHIGKGYQYQNILTPVISNEVVAKTGRVMQVYSGDDHDYCEIIHTEFSGAPKEITVKSMSLAMSVRVPAVQLATLWNPIDTETGSPLDSGGSSTTLQNQMCLLPNQISIFIVYGYTFALTVLALILHSIYLSFRHKAGSSANTDSILPLAYRRPTDAYYPCSTEFPAASPSTTSSNSIGGAYSVTRSRAASTTIPHEARGFKQTQTVGGSAEGNNGVPDSTASTAPSGVNNRSRRPGWSVLDNNDYSEIADPSLERGLSSRVRRPFQVFRDELVSSTKWVGGISFGWYLWLLWTW